MPRKKSPSGRTTSSPDSPGSSSTPSPPGPSSPRPRSRGPPAGAVQTKAVESTITTRAGQYTAKIAEYEVLPQFTIPKLNLDDVMIRDVDLESSSSFDSDLGHNVEEFSPLYTALTRKDKFYVMANIKHMLNSDKTMATSTPSAPYRPKSPEHFKSLSTRCKEKEELRDLNERLLVYVNHMRTLKEIEETESFSQTETELTRIQDSLKELIHVELDEARRLLDETANQKAALELENGRCHDTIDQLKGELAAKDKEIAKLKKLVEELERKLGEALGDVKELRSENKRLTKDNDDLQKQLQEERNNRTAVDKEVVRLERTIATFESEIAKLRGQLRDGADREKGARDEKKDLLKSLEDLKDELDKETLKRIDVENKAQTLREEMEFKESLKDKELIELRREASSTTRTKMRRKEAAEEFAVQLSEALSKARLHFEEEKKALREQLNAVHLKELAAARAVSENHVHTNVLEKEREVLTIRAEIEELRATISRMLSKEKSLQDQIKRFQELLQKAEQDALETDAQHQKDLDRLDRQIKSLLQDYSDLMDVKVTLDMEISAYRKLVQAEETRLHLTPSPKSGKVRSALSFGEAEAPSRKRQRVMEESFTTETNSHVSIDEVSIEQDFVGIKNMTEKEQGMRGWTLTKVCGDESLEYKFPAKASIGPGQMMKVFSGNSGATHNPPLNLVFKKLDSWANSVDLEIRLKNGDGEVVSTYKAKAESSTEYLEEGDQRACSLM